MSVNVLSTKVLIEDMIFTSLRPLEMGPPPHVVIRATQRSSCLQGKYAAPLFSVILRPLVLALGIEHETFRSAVKRVDCKTVVFSSKSVKKSVKRWVRLFRAKLASLERPTSVSGERLFSASFQTFCLTAHAYLNTQKNRLFCSLSSAPPTELILPR